MDIVFNPASSYNMLNTRFYYGIGNSPARDLTEGCKLPNEVEFLLLGCGDIRNILYTVDEISRESQKPRFLNFTINDVDNHCLARNIALLSALNEINSDKKEDIDFLWSIWYNMHLHQDHHQRLVRILDDLIKSQCQNILFPDDETRRIVVNILRSWRHLSISLDQVQKDRENMLEAQFETDSIKNILRSLSISESYKVCDLGENVPRTVEMETYICYGARRNIYKANERRELNALLLYASEIEDYLIYGSTRDASGELDPMKKMILNPTLYRTEPKRWSLHYCSHPFLSFNWLLFDKNRSLRENCVNQLTSMVSGWRRMMMTSNIKITVWTGDALTLCTLRLPEEKLFHFIDTSNMCDTLGLLNILVTCSNRLKRNGVLITQTFHMYMGNNTPGEFLRKEIGIPKEFFPTLLGLRLAEDFEIGKEYLRVNPTSLYKGDVEIRWINCNHSCSQVDLRNSPELVNAFTCVAKSCLRTFQEETIVHCPLTLVLVIKRISHKIKGGATALTKIADKCLEIHTDGNAKRFTPLQMEWDMLKSIHLDLNNGNRINSIILVECPVLRMVLSVRKGADAYLRCKISNRKKPSVFHVTTIPRFDHTMETLSLMFPSTFLSADLGEWFVFVCHANGSPFWIMPFALNADCSLTPIKVHGVSELKSNSPESENITESRKAFEFPIYNSCSTVVVAQYIVVKRNSTLVTVIVTPLCLDRLKRSEVVTVAFPYSLKQESKTILMLPHQKYIVRVQKLEDFHGLDIMPRRHHRKAVSDQSHLIDPHKHEVLCNIMAMHPFGTNLEDSKHSDVGEVFRTLFQCVKSLESGIAVRVNVLLGRKECIIQPSGMFAEDMVIYILRIREERGLPMIDCIYFDWEIIHENDIFNSHHFTPSSEMLIKMGHTVQIGAHNIAVHANVARQLRRIFKMNIQLTTQTTGSKGQPIKWFFEVTLKPIFPYICGISESQQLCERLQGFSDPEAMLSAMPQIAKDMKNVPEVKDTCSYCKLEGYHYKKCAVCKTALYCGKECQKKDWKMHKRLCQRQKFFQYFVDIANLSTFST